LTRSPLLAFYADYGKKGTVEKHGHREKKVRPKITCVVSKTLAAKRRTMMALVLLLPPPRKLASMGFKQLIRK